MNWLWLIPAVIVGAMLGLALGCICAALGRESECERCRTLMQALEDARKARQGAQVDPTRVVTGVLGGERWIEVPVCGTYLDGGIVAYKSTDGQPARQDLAGE